jgi:hypothetical protein
VKRIYLFGLMLLVAVLVASVAIHTQAASNLQVSQFGNAGYTVTGTADTNDGDNLDYVCVVCRNNDGSLNDVDIVSFTLGSDINYSQGCNNQVDPASQPIPPYSVAVFDVTGPFAGRLDSAEGATYCESFEKKATTVVTTTDASPTCIDLMPIPDWAVGGKFVSDAVLYWNPSADAATEYVIPAEQSAWVTGVDESGEYAKIIWVCDTLWVKANTLGPNPDYPWNGAPLPTVVVN